MSDVFYDMCAQEQVLQHTATHCNTLQHGECRMYSTTCAHRSKCVAVCCSVLQCVAVCCSLLSDVFYDMCAQEQVTHTATHCNTLQYAATHCNTLQHTATHCNTLQHTATHCNTLQHTATHCILRHVRTGASRARCRRYRTQSVCIESENCRVYVYYAQGVRMRHTFMCCSVLQCVAAYCSVLQCVAVCCSENAPHIPMAAIRH